MLPPLRHQASILHFPYNPWMLGRLDDFLAAFKAERGVMSLFSSAASRGSGSPNILATERLHHHPGWAVPDGRAPGWTASPFHYSRT